MINPVPPKKYLKIYWNMKIFTKVGFLGGQGEIGFEPTKMIFYIYNYLLWNF